MKALVVSELPPDLSGTAPGDAVVDERLRIVGSNADAPTIVIAEKAVGMIRAGKAAMAA